MILGSRTFKVFQLDYPLYRFEIRIAQDTAKKTRTNIIPALLSSVTKYNNDTRQRYIDEKGRKRP